MTSTSGPGLSLMTEYAGLAYFAEVPVVVWDVQRVGPSTGLPTRTAQGDLTFVHFMGHGDTQQIILLPGSVNECFEFGWRAFDIAERLQTPVFVLSDLDLGMNQWMTEPFEYPDTPDGPRQSAVGRRPWNAGRATGRATRMWMAMASPTAPCRATATPRPPISPAAPVTTMNARYTEDPEVWHDMLERLKKKFETARSLCARAGDRNAGWRQRSGIIAFGSTDAGHPGSPPPAERRQGMPSRLPARAGHPLHRRGGRFHPASTSESTWSR